MGKEIVVVPYNEILLSSKNEEPSNVHNNMGES